MFYTINTLTMFTLTGATALTIMAEMPSREFVIDLLAALRHDRTGNARAIHLLEYYCDNYKRLLQEHELKLEQQLRQDQQLEQQLRQDQQAEAEAEETPVLSLATVLQIIEKKPSRETTIHLISSFSLDHWRNARQICALQGYLFSLDPEMGPVMQPKPVPKTKPVAKQSMWKTLRGAIRKKP